MKPDSPWTTPTSHLDLVSESLSETPVIQVEATQDMKLVLKWQQQECTIELSANKPMETRFVSDTKIVDEQK